MTDYPDAVSAVFEAFNGRDAIRLVGGCVRDMFLNVVPKDWDMATPALPSDVIKILEDAGFRPFDLSNGHGTISVVIDGETIEITTLRVDAETDGRHAKVEFTTNWELDAERRDFTWNAMSLDANGAVYDYFDGRKHLNNNEIHFVGFAGQRIKEDYLRILRYFRFAGRFNMRLDQHDLFSIISAADGLREISGERIWMEMQKIIVGPQAKRMMAVMKQVGVLDAIGLITKEI